MNEQTTIEQLAQNLINEKPGWKECYEAAPEGAKRFFRDSFGMSAIALSRPGELQDAAQKRLDERSDMYRNMSVDDFMYILPTMNGVCKSGVGMTYAMMRGRSPEYKLGWWQKLDQSLMPKDEYERLSSMSKEEYTAEMQRMINENCESLNKEIKDRASTNKFSVNS